MLRRFRTALAPAAAVLLVALAGCGDDVTEVTQVYEPPPSETTSALCQDAVDNDGDSLADCDDPDCQGFVFCLPPTEDTSALCADGLDNDGDTMTDCGDSGCAAFCASGTELTSVACQDAADNDGDGDTDCDDADCQGFVFCLAPTEDTSTLCADGLDNDGDAATDCDDPDCQGFVFCVPTAERDSLCADGLDNDGDGHVDCNDPGCWDSSSCQVFNGYPVKDSWGATWDGVERSALSLASAAAECAAAGGRLPTVTELYRVSQVLTGDVGSSYETNPLWSIITNSQGLGQMVRLSDGVVSAVSPVTLSHFRCIWPKAVSVAFDETACFGPPGDACANVRRVYNLDTWDRPALDFVAASHECNFLNGSIPMVEDWSDAIHSGALTGTPGNWLWGGDYMYLATGPYILHPLVQVDPSAAQRWAYDATGSMGSWGWPNNSYRFRCIGKRSAAEGVDPVSPPCNGGCFQLAGRRSPLWVDSVTRPLSNRANAAAACAAAGGSLPTALEFQELVHAGWAFSGAETATWFWTSTPIYAGGSTHVIARRHTFTDPKTWYAIGGGSVSWNEGLTNYPFRCVWHQTVQSSPPTCALGEEPGWDGTQFTCAARVPGDDGGQATAPGFTDPWANDWDGADRTAATFDAATTTCETAGGRLPTPTELHRVRGGGIAPAPNATSSLLWTNIPAPSVGVVVTERLSDGATSSVGDSTPSPFRCIWPASRGNVFGGNACAGDPGTAGSPLDPCFRTARHVTDRLDRPALYASSAAEECKFYGGSLVALRPFEEILHGGAPNGSNAWLWLAEPAYTGSAFAVDLARWTGTGSPAWVWSAGNTTGTAGMATSGARYRCVFNDLLR